MSGSIETAMYEQLVAINNNTSGGGGPATNVTITGPKGQQVMANSIPVVIASDQTSSNSVTIIGPFGQATKVASLPVTIASDQPLATPSGQTVKASSVPVTMASDQPAMSVSISSPTLGQKTMANSFPVVIASDQTSEPSSVTIASPLGQTTMSASLPVTLASNQSNVPVAIQGTPNVAVTSIPSVTIGSPVGQTTMSASIPVTLASNQSNVPVAVQGTATVSVSNTPSVTISGTPNVNSQLTATDGDTPFHAISAASTNSTNVKGSQGCLGTISISNTNAAARYFKLYNKATAPTVGTDTPIRTIQVPPNSTVVQAFPNGMSFTNGIGFGATGAMGDSDTTAISAGDLSMDLSYK